MKKRILIIAISLLTLFPISAKAIDKDTLSLIGKEKFNGWFFDRDINNWNFFKNGEMIKDNWINDNGKIYYAKIDGAVVNGWYQINNNWYFFNKYNGSMQTGWIKQGSNWYYLNADGTMAHDTTIDGYNLGSNGAWVQ